ncbi:MAG: SGNH/GDSL hydrolase family protein [Nocardioides marinisabuli]|uniref:SGNH/GDSL hydrolase family protein n=1 Tax=Nocardioides marinisabuli TaxID=419476 RepID=UPI00321BE65C
MALPTPSSDRHGTRYLRFAALGDSTTVGLGDPVATSVSPTGWRGWARLLADALATSYDVSFCNLAVTGATAGCVVAGQLDEAVAHRPDVASLIVGVNDTMRSTWDPVRLREDLMGTAEALHGTGALLLSARFHDHGRVLGLPAVLRRPLGARIEAVNEVYDEVHATFGGLRIDLGLQQEVLDRSFWSVDRLHPSELGHRVLAHGFARLLVAEGLTLAPVATTAEGGLATSWRSDLRWCVAEGAPWIGRRARDLGPWAVRTAWHEARAPRRPAGRAEPRALPARAGK